MPEQGSLLVDLSATPPGNNETVVLLDTTKLLKPFSLRGGSYTTLDLIFTLLDQASATDGLKGYHSADGGTTWRPVSIPNPYVDDVVALPKTIAAIDADTNGNVRLDISWAMDFKLEFTAGSAGPTPLTGWEGFIVLSRNQGALAR